MRLSVLGLIVLVLVAAGSARAHAPTTAIGRAVEALQNLSVSYDPGAAVSDIEAGGFPQVVGSNPKLAFMPEDALTEIQGGPNAIAEEVAREAGLDGTLVVFVGRQPGAWSEDIGDDRLATLLAAARAQPPATPPAAVAESLVRSVQAEPVASDPPWVWIGAGLLALALGAVVVLDRAVRRRP